VSKKREEIGAEKRSRGAEVEKEERGSKERGARGGGGGGGG
jgi:hypothetical protein